MPIRAVPKSIPAKRPLRGSGAGTVLSGDVAEFIVLKSVFASASVRRGMPPSIFENAKRIHGSVPWLYRVEGLPILQLGGRQIRALSHGLASARDRIGSSHFLALPLGGIRDCIVRKHSMRAARSGRAINLGQPASVLLNCGCVL
jgi:hypothetical protein